MSKQTDFIYKLKAKYSLYEYNDSSGLIYLYPNYLYNYSYPWLIRQSNNELFIHVNVVTDYRLTKMKGFMDFTSLNSHTETICIFEEDRVFELLDSITKENNKIIKKMKQYQVEYKLKVIEDDFVK